MAKRKKQMQASEPLVVRHPAIFKIAGPMIFCNVLQTLFNIVDMMWVGKLGVASIAAVSWAGNVLTVLVTLIIGLSRGTTAIITRNIGAKTYDEASRTAFHALLLGVLVSFLLALWGYFFIETLAPSNFFTIVRHPPTPVSDECL